jgi:hypothetical protein
VDTLAGELGPEHRDTLTARNNLAITCLDLGRPGRAHDLLREVYRARREHRDLGPTHRETLVALNNLAIARGHLGSSAVEQARHRRVAHRYWLGARERWRHVARTDDQYALDVLNGLALSYRALGMREQALEGFHDLRGRREKLLGPGHPDTLSAAENVLIMQCELGDRPDSAFQAILLGRLRSQGPGHHRTGATMRNLFHNERPNAVRWPRNPPSCRRVRCPQACDWTETTSRTRSIFSSWQSTISRSASTSSPATIRAP